MGSNGDHPVTAVRSAEGCRRKTIPLDIEPERGQVPENLSPDGSVVESKEVRHVLHDNESGSKLANGSGHFAPQNGFGVSESLQLSEGACTLAGEAADDDADSFGTSSNCPYVVVDADSGPASGEDASSPGIDLAEPAVLKAGEVESVGQQSDAVE